MSQTEKSSPGATGQAGLGATEQAGPGATGQAGSGAVGLAGGPSEPSLPSLEEIQRALDDVKRIRGVLDSSRHSYVLRRIFRPALLFGFVAGPSIVLFAGLMEWVYQHAGSRVWGVSKAELLWLLGGACMLLNLVLKMVFFRVAAQREGYSLGRFVRQVYRADYLRLYVPVLVSTTAACVAVARLGAPEMIAAILTMMIGVIWVMLPLALPLPESSIVGSFFLVGGVFAMFLLPEYPFAKVAVVWGLGIGVLMPLGYWVSGPLARAGAGGGGPVDGGSGSGDGGGGPVDGGRVPGDGGGGPRKEQGTRTSSDEE